MKIIIVHLNNLTCHLIDVLNEIIESMLAKPALSTGKSSHEFKDDLDVF